MTGNKEYNKVVELLKKNRPVLHNKTQLVENVLSQATTKDSKHQLSIFAYLFRWTSVGWIRNSMSTAAAIFLGFFIIQQLLLNKRLNSLEQQIVRSINGIEQLDSKIGLKEKVLVSLLTNQSKDSITISTTDLNNFLEAYIELQESQEKTNRSSFLGSYKKRFLEKRQEEELINEALKQNL
ncbi:MAG: hypothetical protein U9N53_00855 [Bacteroidota bacterium]|nr:hypothetical protein [Bacteroidota bacterium]